MTTKAELSRKKEGAAAALIMSDYCNIVSLSGREAGIYCTTTRYKIQLSGFLSNEKYGQWREFMSNKVSLPAFSQKTEVSSTVARIQ